jgi:hypothetical protein
VGLCFCQKINAKSRRRLVNIRILGAFIKIIVRNVAKKVVYSGTEMPIFLSIMMIIVRDS